jgi:hypothetical protein
MFVCLFVCSALLTRGDDGAAAQLCAALGLKLEYSLSSSEVLGVRFRENEARRAGAPIGALGFGCYIGWPWIESAILSGPIGWLRAI